MKKTAKRGAGGKLGRSEIVQTRLDPKLRFAAELMAKQQGRSLSSFIEQLIKAEASVCKMGALSSDKAQNDDYLFAKRREKPLLVRTLVNRIWSTEPSERFALMALYLPDLLTCDEMALWRWIRNTPYFWEHFAIRVENHAGDLLNEEAWPMVDQHSLRRDRLREYWPQLVLVKEGKTSVLDLNDLAIPDGSDDEVLPERPSYYPYPFKKISSSNLLPGYRKKTTLRKKKRDDQV